MDFPTDWHMMMWVMEGDRQLLSSIQDKISGLRRAAILKGHNPMDYVKCV